LLFLLLLDARRSSRGVRHGCVAGPYEEAAFLSDLVDDPEPESPELELEEDEELEDEELDSDLLSDFEPGLLLE
jgi:hypothetical protein